MSERAPVLLSVSRARCALAVAGVLVVTAGLAAELLERAVGHPLVITSRLSLSYEGNLPTFYSTVLLFSCALALAVLAQSAVDRRADWRLLSLVFALMALDEAASFHELLNQDRTLGGVFFYGWVIPGIAVVALLAVFFLPFVAGLHKPLRGRIVVAGSLYVGGALVVELVLGVWTDRHGQLGLGYALIDLVEEALEIAGASVFLWALLCQISVVNARVAVLDDSALS